MGFIKSIQTKMSHAIGDGCGTAHSCTAEYSEHKRLYYHNPNGMSAGTADTTGSYAVVLSHCRVCGKYSGRYQSMGFGEHFLPSHNIGDDLTVRLWETGEVDYFAERAKEHGDVRYSPSMPVSPIRINPANIPIGGGSPVFGGEVKNYEINVEATRTLREIMNQGGGTSWFGTPWYGVGGHMVLREREIDNEGQDGAGI